MTPIVLSNFRKSRNGRLWLVTGSNRETYTLPTELLAANAQRFAELQEPVMVESHAGFYYRTASMIWTVENWAIEQERRAEAASKARDAWSGPKSVSVEAR